MVHSIHVTGFRRRIPSRTALGVARALLIAANDPIAGRLVPDGAAATTHELLRALGPGRLPRRSPIIDWLRHRTWLRAGPLHIALRKRFVADVAEAEIRAGASQLIVLGAGFDVLAQCLASRHPSLRAFEVDQPLMHEWKRDALERMRRPDHLELVAADLAAPDPLAPLLAARGFDGSARSVVIAEGLLMYLPPPQVEAILDFVARRTGAGTRLVFTFLDSADGGGPRITRAKWFVRYYLWRVREPFRWWIRRDELAGFLTRHGLALEEQFDERRLIDRYRVEVDRERLFDWEFVASALRR